MKMMAHFADWCLDSKKMDFCLAFMNFVRHIMHNLSCFTKSRLDEPSSPLLAISLVDGTVRSRGSGEANSAASDARACTFFIRLLVDNHCTSNNAVGAEKVESVGLLPNLGKAILVSSSLLEITSHRAVARAVTALIRVEVATRRGAAHAAITKLVDVEAMLARAKVANGAIDDNLTTGLLGEKKSTADSVLLLGVLKGALGVDSLVGALSSAILDEVAIGANSGGRCLVNRLSRCLVSRLNRGLVSERLNLLRSSVVEHMVVLSRSLVLNSAVSASLSSVAKIELVAIAAIATVAAVAALGTETLLDATAKIVALIEEAFSFGFRSESRSGNKSEERNEFRHI